MNSDIVIERALKTAFKDSVKISKEEAIGCYKEFRNRFIYGDFGSLPMFLRKIVHGEITVCGRRLTLG